MITIAVLARTLNMYHKAIPHILPFLENAHGLVFKNNGTMEIPTYTSTKFKIIPALKFDHVQGLENYQLIKFGDWWENEDAAKIDQHWQMDNTKFLEKRKVL